METGRAKREGVSQRAFPSESGVQASAGGHGHILLPSTQPLMRDVGGGGGGSRRQLGRDPLRAHVESSEERVKVAR